MAGDAFRRQGSTYPGRAVARVPLVDPTRSPLLDRSGDGWVLTTSTSPVVHLSPARRRFLATAAAAGARPILLTPDDTACTLAFAEALRSLGGAWVARSDAGDRDTRTGRRLERPEAVFEPDLAPRPAPEHARPPAAETVQLSVLASIRHRNRRRAEYGGAFQVLADLLVEEAALDWGVAEPATTPLDLEPFATFVREGLAHQPFVVVTGDGASGRAVSGTLRMRPTKQGAEEIVNLVADVGPEGSADAVDALADAPAILADLMGEGVPLIAVAFGRVGRADLHAGSTFERPGAPLALLIGAPAVSRLDLPVAALAARFDASVVGPPRAPALVVSLGDDIGLANLERLHELLWALGPASLADAAGPRIIDALLGPSWREEAAARAERETTDAT